jgi:transcriptional regulator with PAS, ATPase and Fis domain
VSPDDGVDVSELAQDVVKTEQLGTGAREIVRRFRLVGIEGGFAGQTWESPADRCSLGSHQSNDLVVNDTSVSRFHCELRADHEGVRIRDLGSSNGTIVDGMQVVEAWLRHGSHVRVGRTTLQFELATETNRLPIAAEREFGSLVGASALMRSTFALLQRAAASDVTVLIEGETGTGKEGAAESIHAASTRRDQPFLVLDCSAIPVNLLESELFGHEKGAFTGAASRRLGIFEAAHEGTVFLDEIGELPSDLQPKLLRVLERREIRRLGSNAHQAVDVRVVAATNRDLRSEVNAGRFRADIYFRLAVLKISMPPLRERPEDIPILVERIVDSLTTDLPTRERLLEPHFLARLSRCAWPGNVRELRNFLERCLVLDEQLLPGERAGSAGTDTIDPTVSYAEARRRALDSFERRYLDALLRHHGGRVASAARAAGIDRVYLYRLLHRHGLR